MTLLATVRTEVRRDLHDEDATAYRWTDTVLDRHIDRAVDDYSRASPLETKSTLSTVAGSRDISISALVPRIRIVAVEWPVASWPPDYSRFSVWGETLTLDVPSPPSAIENAYVYWHKAHTLTTGASDIPDLHDGIIQTGAAAYAALEWASYASNRLNVAGNEAWGQYYEFGNRRLAEFKAMLRALPEQNRLRQHALYPAYDASLSTSQSRDPGP
ncbi:MAG: hypothetical protein A2V63_13405 [Candidatus Eisenbacteria bacterium RBG_19FT_COMBO_70_11]|nr:MAG: hypothetical protein A2V63_13405 [Candidatus Eisenbacteria bacterium RBG_19FT_COMBO_70_11]